MSVLNWLKPATLAATVVVAGSLLAAEPVQAQDVTVLRGTPPPRPSSSIDCNNPYHAQYCPTYDGWHNQSYSPYSYGYPYYGYGLPVRIGAGLGFSHRGGFHGGFHAGGFHGGGGHR